MTTETESKLSDLANSNNRQKLHPIMLKNRLRTAITNCPRTWGCEDLRYRHRPDWWEPQPAWSESHNTKAASWASMHKRVDCPLNANTRVASYCDFEGWKCFATATRNNRIVCFLGTKYRGRLLLCTISSRAIPLLDFCGLQFPRVISPTVRVSKQKAANRVLQYRTSVLSWVS